MHVLRSWQIELGLVLTGWVVATAMAQPVTSQTASGPSGVSGDRSTLTATSGPATARRIAEALPPPMPVPAKLRQVRAVVFRGVPLREAIARLAEQVGVRYILDASVSVETLDQPVRLSASHLTGEQAFRWLARSGGLTAVLVDGVFLVAMEERLPVVWKALGTGGSADRASDQARWQRVKARQVDLDWVDTPLSGVAEDVSAKFGVDVLFHPAYRSEPHLIYFKGSGVSVDAVREVISKQLGARVTFVDGVLWVCPPGEVQPWLPTTSAPAPSIPEVADTVAASAPLDAWVVIDRSVGDWQALGATIGGAAGVSCQVDAPAGLAYPGLEARGTVGEVLEAIRMLGWGSWMLEPGTGGNEARLSLRLRQKG